MKENRLREVIVEVLKDTTIDDGTNKAFERIVDELEQAISDKISRHEIDFYTENDKKVER